MDDAQDTRKCGTCKHFNFGGYGGPQTCQWPRAALPNALASWLPVLETSECSGWGCPTWEAAEWVKQREAEQAALRG